MWLVGMMGSGKTSVGRLAAQALDVGFYDSDEAVAAMQGGAIAEIWDDVGECHFRDLERSAIAAAPRNAVAAAGGGAVLDPGNRRAMRLDPPVIWLRARPDTLASRLGGATDRPLLAQPRATIDVLRDILADRTESYVAAATHIVDTDDRTLENVASEVIELWPG